MVDKDLKVGHAIMQYMILLNIQFYVQQFKVL